MFVDESGEASEMPSATVARPAEMECRKLPCRPLKRPNPTGDDEREGLLATLNVESPTEEDVLGAYLGRSLRSHLPPQEPIEPFPSSLLSPFS